jgi:hypothetical protein
MRFNSTIRVESYHFYFSLSCTFATVASFAFAFAFLGKSSGKSALISSAFVFTWA